MNKLNHIQRRRQASLHNQEKKQLTLQTSRGQQWAGRNLEHILTTEGAHVLCWSEKKI